MTRWEHRTVIVTAGDDGPVNAACAEGWEPYAAASAAVFPASATPCLRARG